MVEDSVFKLGEIHSNFSKGFFDVLECEVKKYSWDLDLNRFPEVDLMERIARTEYFKEIFDFLNTIHSNPCLYQFDLISEPATQEINSRLKKVRDEILPKGYKMAPVNKGVVSNCLYVGIRQKGFINKKGLSQISSRLLSHLGYYDKGSGVKFKNWTDLRDIRIRMSVFVLHEACEPYLEIIEKLYAMEVEPMIGNH